MLHVKKNVTQQEFQTIKVIENDLFLYDFHFSGAGVLKPLRRASLYSRFFCCQSCLPGPDVCGEPRHRDYHRDARSLQHLVQLTVAETQIRHLTGAALPRLPLKKKKREKIKK